MIKPKSACSWHLSTSSKHEKHWRKMDSTVDKQHQVGPQPPNTALQHPHPLRSHRVPASRIKLAMEIETGDNRGTIRTLPTKDTRHGFIALSAASSHRPKFTKASSSGHCWPCPMAEKLFQAHHFVMRVPVQEVAISRHILTFLTRSLGLAANETSDALLRDL